MASTNPAKKRKADSGPPPPPGNDAAGAGTILSVNLTLADLDRLIDRRVADAVETKILALASRVDGLQRENEALLLRCESLERSVQVLKKEGNWTYSAPAVPWNHWIDQGHDEDYAHEADWVVQSIKDCTKDLRSHGSEMVIVSCETPILFDDALSPHWEQLANAIQLNERISQLNFLDVQLNEGTLQMIEASVRQKGITEFGLCSNEFLGGEGIEFAINILNSNRSVQTFTWTWNPFHSTEEACDLVDAVLEHPNIKTLVLRGSLVARYTPVKCLLGGKGIDQLRTINLSNNIIRMNGDRCIADFLSTNPPLQTLDLEGNRLTDDDAHHIALALQSNTNLRVLNLADNSLTADGKDKTFCQAILGLNRLDLRLISAVNLNIVSGANHTCKIAGISSGDNILCTNRDDRSAKSNRGQKLFGFLVCIHREGCGVSQLELEFSKDCIGLVPHVLACINTYSSNFEGEGILPVNVEKNCLSILFELMRDWKTPEIYQFNRKHVS